MEMAGVFEERIEGREIGTTAEPPHRSCLEVAVIEVHRGHIGVAGCNTIEVPVANQGCPFASGRCLRMEGGNSWP